MVLLGYVYNATDAGFYIHACQKMRYKSTYAPSELLDTSDNQWHPFAQVAPLLDAGVRHSFARRCTAIEALPPGAEHDAVPLPRPLPPGMDDPAGLLQGGDTGFLLLVSAQGPAVLQPVEVRMRSFLVLISASAASACASTWFYFGLPCGTGTAPGAAGCHRASALTGAGVMGTCLLGRWPEIPSPMRFPVR